MTQWSRCGAQNRHGVKATDVTKASGFCFLAGSLCFGEEGQQRRVWNRGRREEERKEGRDDRRDRGGGGEQRGRKGGKGIEGKWGGEKAFGESLFFFGEPSAPWTLNTRGKTFCGVVRLLRSSFFVDFACKQQCSLIPGETYSALILVVEGNFYITFLRNLLRTYSGGGNRFLTSPFYEEIIPALIGQ